MREFLETITATEAIDGSLKDFAATELAKLDAKNARRKEIPSKTQIENEPIKTAILKLMADGTTRFSNDVAEAIGISTSKASALLRQLVDENHLSVMDAKVPSKGIKKAYTLSKIGG